MKPDDHKKKKSAQYQKKHTKSQGKTDNSKKEKPGKPYDEQHQNRREEEKNTKPASSRETGSSESSSSDSENERPVKKTFQRRKVDSNWTRYEERVVDYAKETKQKEEDFQRLLSAKVTADAQFLLKDEQEWEDELGNGETPDILSIDCKDLAKSIQDIPIYTRLGIEDLAEQAGLINNKKETPSKYSEMCLSTAFNKRIHSDNTSASIQSSCGSGILPSALSDLLKKQSLNDTNVDETNSKPTLNFSIPKPAPIFDEPVTEKDISEMFWNDAPPAVAEPKVNDKRSKEESTAVNDDDEDLDLLLSLDRPVVTAVSRKEETQSKHTDDTADADKDSPSKRVCLDKKSEKKISEGDNSSADGTKNSPSKSLATNTVEKKPEPAKETQQDLEEWLDSII